MDNTIQTTRIIKATPERIWEALTTPEQVAQWWGPQGFRCEIKKMEVHPGGEWEFNLYGPDGRVYPNKLVYIKLQKPSFLSYRHNESTEYGLAAWEASLTIEPLDEKSSRLTLKSVYEDAEEKAKHTNQMHAEKGARETLQRLAGVVE